MPGWVREGMNPSPVLIIWILNLRACFGFRASNFKFIDSLVLLNLERVAPETIFGMRNLDRVHRL